jgi:hypothetical protein
MNFNKMDNEKKTVYIAGKISGIESEAIVYFQRAEDMLLKLGYEVVNPMKLPHNHDKSWEAYMKECIKSLVDCDFIYLLENWTYSPGAIIEFNLAYTLKIEILRL